MNCNSTSARVISSGSLLLGPELLWCPVAKVGTTTAYKYEEFRGEDHIPHRCSSLTKPPPPGHIYLANAEKHRCETTPIRNVCAAKVSFAFVRNPWDRMYSWYVNKILRHASNIMDMEPTFRRMHRWSFRHFVKYIAEHPTENVHWTPYSETCFAAGLT